MPPIDLPPVTIQDAHHFDQRRPNVVITAEGSHRRHPLHVPLTSSVTELGAEPERDSASNAINYDIVLGRIQTISLFFHQL